MPEGQIGTCCGSYNVTQYIVDGGLAIDTSPDYQSQPEIGVAIRASGTPRSQFWITSKLNPAQWVNVGGNVSGNVYQQDLIPLGFTGSDNYLDLLLLHFAGQFEGSPYPPSGCADPTLNGTKGVYFNCRIGTYQSFMGLRKAGVARAIGVSNWQVREFQQLYAAVGEYPAMNQIEIHPSYYDLPTIQFCNQNGIAITAYGPMGAYPRSNDINDPRIAAIATAHGKTPGQVMIQFGLQLGANITIPRSNISQHMEENMATWSPAWQMTDAEMSTLLNWPQTKVYHTMCQPFC